MLNIFPIVGWIVSGLTSCSLAVPFWICWTACGIGTRYFYWLPERYQSLPFWHCVGLFIVASILKGVLTPRFVSVSQTNSKASS